jgi:hypothetical protein
MVDTLHTTHGPSNKSQATDKGISLQTKQGLLHGNNFWDAHVGNMQIYFFLFFLNDRGSHNSWTASLIHYILSSHNRAKKISSYILLTFFSESSHIRLTIFSLLSSYVSECCSVSERSNFFLKRADRDFLLYTNTMSPSRQKSHITEINKDTHTRETYCEDVEATLIYLATLSTICISWSIANLPKEAALTVEH